MRNLKKILAVICVVAMMASIAIVPALAAGFANESQATTLNTLGVMAGMNLGDEVTRIQGLTFAIKAAGKDAAAQALTQAEVDAALANVVDAKDIPAWGAKYAAYAVSTAMTTGVDASVAPKIKFAPLQAISGDSFLVWTLKSMGYTTVGTANAWETAVTDAKVLTLSQGYTVHGAAKLIRDDVAGILYGALDNGVCKDGKAFVDTLIAAGMFTQQQAADAGLTTPPAPAALAVTSVTAPNVKQIVITFNKALDGDSAADIANYSIQDKGTATAYTLVAGNAVLSSDKQTVTITLNNVDKMTNSTNAKVTVKKDLKDADGKTLGTDYTNSTVSVFDGLVPQVIKAEAIGNKNIKLTFNKPVYDGTDADISPLNFAIKNGTYSLYVSKATADYANATVTLDLGTNMTDGNIVVTINNAGSDAAGAIQDFGGIKAFKGESTFAYAKDASVPTVTVKEATQSKIVLTFNKPVKGTNVTLYHSLKGVANYGVTMTKTTASDTWQFDFPASKKVPTGNLTIYLANSSVDSEKLVDLYGNLVPDTSLPISITADTTAPSVSSSKVNTNVSFEIKFNEAIDQAEIKNANFALTKASDGKDVSFTVSLKGGTTDTILVGPSSGTYTDNTSYNLVIKSMKDLAGNVMASTSLSFAVTDNTNASVTDAFVVGKDIFITFSEAMNASQMADKANYLVDPDGVGAGSGFVALGDNDSVTAVTDKQVKITYAAGGLATPHVKIFPITDLAGKRIGANDMVGYQPAKLTSIGASTLTISKAELVAKNKIKLTFDKELSNLDASELKITDSVGHAAFAGAANLNVSAVESMTTNSDGVTEAVIVLDQDVNTDATEKTTGHAIEINSIAVPANTKSVQGTVLGAIVNKAVDDKLAPEISKIVFVNAGEIEVYFSELLDTTTLAASGKNGFTTAGGTLATAQNFGSTDDILVLTSTENTTGDFTVDTDVTYTPGQIKDLGGNALAAKTWTDAQTIGAITTTADATPDNTFTISDNFDTGAYVAADIDMNPATPASDASIQINGVTYTRGIAGSVVTITSDGAASTATAAQTTVTIKVTHDGVSKNVTMTIPAATATVAGGQPVFN